MIRAHLMLALTLAGCQPALPQSATFAALPPATPEPIWVTESRAATAARYAACPTLPHGCFAAEPSCAERLCACPIVCAPARSTGRLYRPRASECACQ